MMILDRFCCYRSDRHEYFGRVPIRKMIYPTIIAMVFTQLFISIYYLTFQVWWWFIGLFICLLANAALVYAVRKRFVLIVKGFLVYEIAFTIVFIVASIWMLALLCNPHSNSYMWRKCMKHYKPSTSWNCADSVRTQGGIYFPIYMFFAFINGFCLIVVYNYVQYLSRPLESVNYNNQARTPSRPAGVPPPTPTATSNNQQTNPTSPSGGVGPLSPSNLGQTTYTPYSPQPTMGTVATVGAYNTYNANAQQPQTAYNPYGAQQTGYTSATLNAPPLSPVNQHWDTQPQYQNTQSIQENIPQYDVTPNW